MNDNFIASIRNEWLDQDLEFESVRRRLMRARWMTLALIAFEAVWTLVGLGVGIWFAAIAVRKSDLFFGLSAVTLLFAVPPIAVALVRARSRMLGDRGETPEATLRVALERTYAKDKILQIGLWNALALTLLVGGLWTCAAAGWIERQYPLALFSLIWMGASLANLAWFRWGKRRNARERERCERLLSEFDVA